MSQEWNEWELSKENVQPLRKGRVMSTLQEALAQQETSSHTAIQQQKQEFESEIRFYSGDDPLDVWNRYIKWTEQTFPQGGKESNLSALLERAVKTLNEQQRYYQDPRYLSLWLKFGNYCSEPLDLYNYLHSQEIGTSLALFYVTWAEALEARGSYKKADLIFQEGLLRKAEPLDKLQSHHRQFQARVSRQTLQSLEEDDDELEESNLGASEPQRSSLAELKGKGKKKVKAPISRVGDALKRKFTSQRVSNCPGFAVFDENSVVTAGAELPVLTPQPWAAPPATRAKENELKALDMISLLPFYPRSSTDSGAILQSVLPGFTPYVEESAQQQIMTPCKIEPSINHVLSARKPGKEEDPLQRVQNNQQDAQEKKEQPMYCKEKVYAGVEEFSLEEIRAEIYRKKAKKRREEELQAIAQKKTEIQRKFEEMEKVVKEKQDVQCQQSYGQVISKVNHLHTESSFVYISLLIELLLESAVKQFQKSVNLIYLLVMEGALIFVIYRGTDQKWQVNLKICLNLFAGELKWHVCVKLIFLSLSFPAGHTQTGARRPLAIRKPSDSLTAKENLPPESCDELNGIEPLTEDPIVTGSYKNKTLCPNPEDTCDFVRAAHLASTPFHGIVEQRAQLPTDPEEALKEEFSESKSTSLSQQTPISEGTYNEALCIKKLSPIMEASQEDTSSSGSSASSVSSLTQISTMKYLQISEKLELAQSPPDEIAIATEDNAEQRKELLYPLPELLTTCPDFCLETSSVPLIELGKEIDLGNETYCIKQECWISDDYKIFFAVQVNFAQVDSKGFAIKVFSQPVPWDFYITLQLQDRLNTEFDQNFSENCSCILYRDGCVVLHREINHFTLWDIIQHCKTIPQEVIVLVVHNLLDVVLKLHKAEIILGDLRPEVLFLGDRICDSFANADLTSALKIVDFSHSLDMKLQPRVTSLNSFPVAQTQYGQQMLAECSLPYQVDLIGIADIVHLMLFREHLQVYQEGSQWKIKQCLSNPTDGDLWSQFFEKILNADGKSTVPLLMELREKLNGMFDSSFPERLCDCLTSLEELFKLEDIF
uniref:BUB1 mitotic checkpoint serine/threonine kinase B n=1 Tax=Sphenodon punctatus TaxID=8508 RepID=A0A8D0HU12_SPHPU